MEWFSNSNTIYCKYHCKYHWYSKYGLLLFWWYNKNLWVNYALRDWVQYPILDIAGFDVSIRMFPGQGSSINVWRLPLETPLTLVTFNFYENTSNPLNSTSFLNTKTLQTVQSRKTIWCPYGTQCISWLLMTWWCKKPEMVVKNDMFHKPCQSLNLSKHQVTSQWYILPVCCHQASSHFLSQCSARSMRSHHLGLYVIQHWIKKWCCLTTGTLFIKYWPRSMTPHAIPKPQLEKLWHDFFFTKLMLSFTRVILNTKIPSAAFISIHTEVWDCKTVKTMMQPRQSWLYVLLYLL